VFELSISRKHNILGQRFGMLVVQGATPQRVNREILYECLCDCGNTRLSTRVNLKRRSVTSCGCKKKKQCAELGRGRFQSLIGQQFERLRVISIAKKSNRYVDTPRPKGAGILKEFQSISPRYSRFSTHEQSPRK